MRRIFRDFARPSRRAFVRSTFLGHSTRSTRNECEQEPGQYWGTEFRFPPDSIEVAEIEDAQPFVSPLGLLAPDGTPLVRYVTPAASRPIGFLPPAAREEDFEDYSYITTESEIRMSQTEAGDIEYYEEEDLATE